MDYFEPLVLNPPFKVAELNHRQGDDDGHQYDRLGGRATEIKPDKTVAVNFVNQDVRGPIGPPLGDGVDDAERFEKSDNTVDGLFYGIVNLLSKT